MPLIKKMNCNSYQGKAKTPKLLYSVIFLEPRKYGGIPIISHRLYDHIKSGNYRWFFSQVKSTSFGKTLQFLLRIRLAILWFTKKKFTMYNLICSMFILGRWIPCRFSGSNLGRSHKNFCPKVNSEQDKIHVLLFREKDFERIHAEQTVAWFDRFAGPVKIETVDEYISVTPDRAGKLSWSELFTELRRIRRQGEVSPQPSSCFSPEHQTRKLVCRSR